MVRNEPQALILFVGEDELMGQLIAKGGHVTALLEDVFAGLTLLVCKCAFVFNYALDCILERLEALRSQQHRSIVFAVWVSHNVHSHGQIAPDHAAKVGF